MIRRRWGCKLVFKRVGGRDKGVFGRVYGLVNLGGKEERWFREFGGDRFSWSDIGYS